jgi:LIM domain
MSTDIFCQEHYLARAACSICKLPIKDSIATIGERKFHLKCLICHECHDELQTNVVIDDIGNLFCSTQCANKR